MLPCAPKYKINHSGSISKDENFGVLQGAAPEPITSLHSSQFDQRTRQDASGFMGPLS
jgi:hypothetical protein